MTKNPKKLLTSSNKNRKYIHSSKKEVLTNINRTLNKDSGNPRQEYMDQMKRKQRYTALDPGIIETKRLKGHRKGSHSGN